MENPHLRQIRIYLYSLLYYSYSYYSNNSTAINYLRFCSFLPAVERLCRIYILL